MRKCRNRIKIITAIALLVVINLSCSSTSGEDDSELMVFEHPSGPSSSLPYLVTGEDDELYTSWVEDHSDSVVLKFSKLAERGWTEPEVISSGSDWFVNWADYPMISANKEGKMISHFLAKSSAGTYSYDVHITRKPEESWTESLIPHDDGTPTEHGFVTMIPMPDGQFQLAWLDGRNTGGGHEGDDHSGGGGAMTIRTALMDIDGNLSEEIELDNRVCDCCQTTGAYTANGPVIIYRDRSEMEIRDMSIVRKVDGVWTEPVTIASDNWEIPGCPVNGPRASAIGNNLVVAWFSAANDIPQVKVIFSEDGGQSFGQPLIVDGLNPMGRVDVQFIDETKALVTWLTKSEDGAVIKVRQINVDGSMEKEITVANTNESRGSGFPQMELHKGVVYFAWTTIDENNGTSIKVASLDI